MRTSTRPWRICRESTETCRWGRAQGRRPGASLSPSTPGCRRALREHAFQQQLFQSFMMQNGIFPPMAGRLSVSAMTLLFFLLLFFCQKKWFWHYLTVFFLILQSTHPRFPKENQLNSEPLAKFLSPHNVMINIPIASAKKATNNLCSRPDNSLLLYLFSASCQPYLLKNTCTSQPTAQAPACLIWGYFSWCCLRTGGEASCWRAELGRSNPTPTPKSPSCSSPAAAP